MAKSININGFDISRRIDGSYAVYDFSWWPDDYLDDNTEASFDWLSATGGYRAKGWIIVKVLPSYHAATNWASNWGKPSPEGASA